MRITLAIMLCMLMYSSVQAQITKTDTLKKELRTENIDTVAWLYGGAAQVGFNGAFLHNWPAGGELSSMTINGVFSGHLTYMNHRHVWANVLDMNYSLFYAYSNQFEPRKTNDRIDFTSKYGVRLDTAKDFYITGLFNFKSQFTKGYDYSVPNWDTFYTSEFLSPAYFTLAAGMEYRKGDNLSLFYSPIAARITTADRYHTLRQPEGAFGVEYGETTRFEIGSYFSGRYKWDINKNMLLKTRLDLYSNYLAKDNTDSTGKVVKKDNPGNIDVFIDIQYSWQLTRYVSLMLGGNLQYDNDIPYKTTYIDETGVERLKDEPGQGLGWWQIRQLFTIGFQYKF
jgi:hypothetical protein